MEQNDKNSVFFHFKKFSVRNSSSAMKVGTDAVLLGSWMNVPSQHTHAAPLRLLDIGTGTGVIALMAAQRYHLNHHTCHIDTIDIDEDSLREAQYNFTHSPWNEAFSIYRKSLQEYMQEASGNALYDHIFSNPPYFTNSLKAPDSRKSNARHNDSLTQEEIIEAASSMLKEEGILSLILPFDEAERFRMKILENPDFRLLRTCHVHSSQKKQAFRQMVEFVFKPATYSGFQSERLFIHNGPDYSDEYKALTREFYLKF